MNDIKEYSATCTYTTESKAEYHFFASSEKDAEVIARKLFKKGHTDICKLQSTVIREGYIT